MLRIALIIAVFAAIAPAAHAAGPQPPPARPLCNDNMRLLDQLIADQPEHPRIQTVRVFRYRASLLCRAGRNGEGQLFLQSGIRVLGGEAIGGSEHLDREIEKRERRRQELIDRRLIDP